VPLVLLLIGALILAAPAAAKQPPKPDLVVASISAPEGSVTIGGPVSLGATVRNRGGAGAGASKLGFFLSRDAKRSSDDVALGGRVSIRALKSGKKSTQGTPATIAAGTIAGEYSLLACADVRAKVGEKKEGNNCRAVPLLLAAPPPPHPLPYGNDALPAARPPEAGDLLLTEYFANPDTSSLAGDANGDGVADESDDEFVELVNISAHTLDLEGLVIRDSIEARHTFPAATLNPGCAAVVFGGGGPSGVAGEIVETASSGKLDLSDAGDTVTVASGALVITNEVFSAEGENESLTLPGTSPSFYFKHSAAPGSIGPFSPGLRPNGSAYC
jgi:hypothetical protein